MKLKSFLKILIALTIVGMVFLGYNIYAEQQRENNRNSIVEKIEVETDELHDVIESIINSTVTVKQEELPESLQDKKIEENNVSSIVGDALSNAVESTEGFNNIVVLTSDTFECDYNGEKKTFRLIGLKSNGSKEGLQYLLENATDLNVEYDTIKTKDDVHLVYMWDGEKDSDCKNMINIQMILNKYAESTYMLTSDSIIETPNIKYSTIFMKYQKAIN